jgi:hypothetical protein
LQLRQDLINFALTRFIRGKLTTPVIQLAAAFKFKNYFRLYASVSHQIKPFLDLPVAFF